MFFFAKKAISLLFDMDFDLLRAPPPQDICRSRIILFDKLFRAICNGVYEGNDTELGRNALQVRAKILQNKYNHLS